MSVLTREQIAKIRELHARVSADGDYVHDLLDTIEAHMKTATCNRCGASLGASHEESRAVPAMQARRLEAHMTDKRTEALGTCRATMDGMPFPPHPKTPYMPQLANCTHPKLVLLEGPIHADGRDYYCPGCGEHFTVTPSTIGVVYGMPKENTDAPKT